MHPHIAIRKIGLVVPAALALSVMAYAAPGVPGDAAVRGTVKSGTEVTHLVTGDPAQINAVVADGTDGGNNTAILAVNPVYPPQGICVSGACTSGASIDAVCASDAGCPDMPDYPAGVTVNGNELTIDRADNKDGFRAWFNVQLSNWDPKGDGPNLGAWQVKINCSGYYQSDCLDVKDNTQCNGGANAGLACLTDIDCPGGSCGLDLKPAAYVPCPWDDATPCRLAFGESWAACNGLGTGMCDAGYLSSSGAPRPDSWCTAGGGGCTGFGVGQATCNYTYFSVSNAIPGHPDFLKTCVAPSSRPGQGCSTDAQCPGGTADDCTGPRLANYYAGTLVLDIPAGAKGKYTVELDRDNTLISAPGPIGLDPLVESGFVINVVGGSCCHNLGTPVAGCFDQCINRSDCESPANAPFVFTPGGTCENKPTDDGCAQCIIVGRNTDVLCDDGDACTDDDCTPLFICEHPSISGFDPTKPGGTKCCDGSGYTPVLTPKDDGNDCTRDFCSEPDNRGSAVHEKLPDGTPCPDDGDPTTKDICKDNVCVHIKQGSCCYGLGTPDAGCVDGVLQNECDALPERSLWKEGGICLSEACCSPEGMCQDTDPERCRQQNGVPKGPCSRCLGDGNGDGADDACRRLKDPTDEVFVRVYLHTLNLKWNGDRGEKGRGRGEVFLSIWVEWLTKKTGATRVHHKEVGPLGGDDEFPSGTIKNCGLPGATINPGTVNDGQFGMVYENRVDCPVTPRLFLDTYVWESDGNDDLKRFTKPVSDAIAPVVAAAAAAERIPVTPDLVAAAIDALVNLFTRSGDDALGRCQGCFVDIPDPCAAKFEVERTLPLENLAQGRWQGVNALAEDGRGFRSCGIAVPPEIGTLMLKIVGDKTGNKSSHNQRNPDDVAVAHAAAYSDLQAVNLSQPDEVVIATAMTLGASLPPDPIAPLEVAYDFCLDTDNNLFTGASGAPFAGADFVLQMDFRATLLPISRLLVYNAATEAFEEVPGGLHDAKMALDGAGIDLSVELSALGNPGGPIAGWGVVESTSAVLSVLPPVPTAFALGITPNYAPTGVAPSVVSTDPVHGRINVSRATQVSMVFDKSMDKAQTALSFSMSPTVLGTVAWQGNKLIFTPLLPLAPATRFRVAISPTATDVVGTPLDGNGDGVSGDGFEWEFWTEGLPLFASDASGVLQNGFVEAAPIFVTGTGFVPSSGQIDIYLIANVLRTLANGELLIDVSSDGPSTVQVSNGALNAVPAGSIAVEGEYNVVADLDRDGVYRTSIDRIDAIGTGFLVAPDCNGNGVPDGEDIFAGTSSDENSNAIPDECEGVLGACCDHDPFDGCQDDVLETDCACEKCEWFEDSSCAEIECLHNPIPTVSEWGIVVLTLLLLVGAKVYFGRRQSEVPSS